ncbi:MAG: hypothetical protein KBC33_02075 [Candidatus Pacebacteria bacterium]|nr:hypothetical protein [Candidatus Paceibacterota bacterium]
MLTIPSLKLTVNFIKDRKQVIAYSPALDISTVGRTEEHARKRFEELVHIFMKDITERNVATQVLTELGWTKSSPTRTRKSQWTPPQVRSVNLKVPLFA